MYEFALVEANLFLDSHPDDQEALKYYSKYAGLLQEAKAAYEKQFGSLTRLSPTARPVGAGWTIRGRGICRPIQGRRHNIMWSYSKKLEYPVKIARPNAAAAKVIISQLGGPNHNI